MSLLVNGITILSERQQSLHPIVDMTKAEIGKKRLSNYVIMPEMVGTASLEDSTALQVRYPHECHGNAGKASNSAKTNL